MATDQKRRERKAKKREKIRLKHLAAERREAQNQAISDFFKVRTVVHPHIPDRNDRDGWARFNALNAQAILKKSLQLFRGDKILQKFYADPFSATKYDLEFAEAMMTKAAQAICCSVPYFIPEVRIVRKGDNLQLYHPHFEMQKETTPAGLAWHWIDRHGGSPVAWVGKKARQFAMSTHAIERFMQRVSTSLAVPPVLIGRMFESIEVGKLVRGSLAPLFPIFLTGNDKRMKVGYCPFSEVKHLVVATTFLIPTHDGTPERDQLNKLGLPFVAETLTDLNRQSEFLTKNGIFNV